MVWILSLTLSHAFSLTCTAHSEEEKPGCSTGRKRSGRATENLGLAGRSPKLLVCNGPLIGLFLAPFQEHSEVRKGRWKRRNLTDLLRKMKNVQNKVASINELNTSSLVICEQTLFDLVKLTFERRMFCLSVCHAVQKSERPASGRIIDLFWVTECNIAIERAVWAHLKK